jgi:hypothetical protein
LIGLLIGLLNLGGGRRADSSTKAAGKEVVKELGKEVRK